MSQGKDNTMVSYEGLEEGLVLHALYHGTRAMGWGALHDNSSFSLEDARSWFSDGPAEGEFEPGLGYNRRREGHIVRLDYVAGRPIKVTFDTKAKTIDRDDLYDCDAGRGACARIIDHLRSNQ
jgi:hypothetical protein